MGGTRFSMNLLIVSPLYLFIRQIFGGSFQEFKYYSSYRDMIHTTSRMKVFFVYGIFLNFFERRPVSFIEALATNPKIQFRYQS